MTKTDKKKSLIETIREAAFTAFVAGLAIYYIPFEILDGLRNYGLAGIQIGSTMLIVFVGGPMLWHGKLYIWEFIKKQIEKIQTTKTVYKQPDIFEKSHELFDKVMSTTLKQNLNTAAEILDSIHVNPQILPINPKKHVARPLSHEEAAEMITDAMSLAGVITEQVTIEILQIESGPTLQKIIFRLPEKIQLSKVIAKREDIGNHMGINSGFDIVSGGLKSSVAFLIPQKQRAFVYLRDIITTSEFNRFQQEAGLPVCLGADLIGKPVLIDLTKTPHLLVAGATGSGKSVGINTILASLLLTKSPDELRLYLVDPKLVELQPYAGFPHLLAPPITDPKQAIYMLNKVIQEMEMRYKRLADKGAKNIEQYNVKSNEKMPYIVIIVDEVADLMMVAGPQLEDSILTIAQKARAAGIHIVLATQRPSVDIITGVIKANIPSRIAFTTASQTDSRTILDKGGAEKLLGKGDGLLSLVNGDFIRFQSAAISVSDEETGQAIEDIKEYWKRIASKHNSNNHNSFQIQEETSNPMKDWLESREKKELVNLEIENITEDELDHEELDVENEQINFTDPLQQQKINALKEKLRYHICIRRSARVGELRGVLGVRNETVSELMQEMVEEGFLKAPMNPRDGYKILWNEDEIINYLENNKAFRNSY